MYKKINELYRRLETDSLSHNLTTATPITENEFRARVEKLRQSMQFDGIQAVMLVAGTNMHYFTGLTWSMSERLIGVVITTDEIIYICPKFEESALRARLKVTGSFEFWEEHHDPTTLVANILASRSKANVALDPECPLWLYENLKNALFATQIYSSVSLIGDLRARKSDAEIALITHAMHMTLEVHKLAYTFLQPGIRASDVVNFIDEAHKQLGADRGSYFCAVQFADATSHPHGVPGDPCLQDNSLVLIDTGCQVDGYHSDITRTYAYGNLSNKIKEYWEIEKEAQLAAFRAVKPGVTCEEIDRAARQVLIKHGLGPDYQLPGLPHRTGHGIGLNIHEGPYLVKGDKTKLAQGMCFSNEPMIVVPGEFGIRLEDHFYVTKEGASWFTHPQLSLEQPFC
ncbi:M24 family metallopeptidase [Aliiglaciecola sp. M165]|uniref:M24 family metallopeptidase n=1 Tax=Aliiglaciecola sp. M165 TaxID=2593649 RepID=UPI00117CE177|nr:Xaa-Pro peptidase family protein [Aliiglaciecola sp. M165]TRY29825.1 aminopeptidase P family protein [Aliiglaciecola sp. M165]